MPESEKRGPGSVGPDDPGLGPTQRQADLDRGETLRPARLPTAPTDSLSKEETVRGRKPGDKVFNRRYELKRILGRGGMGVVWLAQDRELEHEVALKFLPDVMAYNEAAILELKRETKKALLLTHPHIVRIHGWERDAENAAVSMEYVDGRTLAALKAEREIGCLEVADIREWARQLCEALEYAHGMAKVVHRDLKPQNLMVNAKGHLKITDFGISRSLEESVSKTTRGGAGFSGTLSYMSPQQLDGRPSEPSDDVYALGATIYELLTGKPPFHTGNLDRQIREAVPPTMAERRKELRVEGGELIPEAWEETVAACLAKEPGQRPGSAKAVWEGLEGKESSLRGAETTVKAAPNSGAATGQEATRAATQHRPNRMGKWLALAAILVLAAFGAWWLSPGRKGADSPTAPKGASNVVAVPPTQAPTASTGQVAQVPAKPDEAQVRREADLKAKPAPVRPAGQSFTNSLGMVFVPVPGTEVMFSIWETRVKDYAAYAAANSGVDGSWNTPGFAQGDTHPVVNVSWDDAVAFCRWLTETERKAGRLGAGQEYRLPTDAEWSYAVGIGDRESGSTPKEKDGKLKDVYPWGTGWPPPSGAGNYGSSSGVDSFEKTSPAGSFKANQYGLFDMGGNVWEWCHDWCGGEQIYRVLRGTSWYGDGSGGLLSSKRGSNPPDLRIDIVGFRVVLAGGGSSPATGQADRTPARPEPAQKPAEELTSPGNKAGTVMTNGIGMELVWISPGKFTMGSPATEAGRDSDEGPQTEVTLTKGYWLGKYEVTQAEYEAVMGSNPWNWKGAQLPVETVSWTDAVGFCRRLTEQERSAGKLPAGYEYRLPTEAQWEYACRAGTKSRFSGGDSDSQLGDAGWYSGNQTHPVGQKQPNAWGLYDMHGNVWEWCSDWHANYPGGSVTDPICRMERVLERYGNYYTDGSVTDPASVGSSWDRVVRGGGWIDNAGGCRSASRSRYPPGTRNSTLGFRAALVYVLEGSHHAQAETPVKVEDQKAVVVPQAGQPFENGLGMRFVRVPGTQVLFSIWETRVKDYAAYAAANSAVDAGWKSPGFAQGDTHPVVNVSWDDAVAFCRWLTETERKAGRLKADQEYRLPTDTEWSYAVGIGDRESGDTPKDKDGKLKGAYPWGTDSQRARKEGNYGSFMGEGRFERTSPAGSYKANQYGLFDMGGNVWEWCQDWYDGEQKYRVMRGASWDGPAPALSCYRDMGNPGRRTYDRGFRVVLADGAAR